MAGDATKIMVGAGTFSIGDYVTAGGAGSLTDIGHIKSPFELAVAMDNFDVETERATGIVYTSPLKDDYTLKVAFHESDPEHLRIALGQVALNLTGTAPNETLLVGNRTAQYHQGTLAVPGIGSTAARTLTFWKLQTSGMEPISFGKGVEQMYAVTFRILRDDSVATADVYWKQVDA